MFSLQTLISNCCIGHDEIKTKDKDQSHFKETRFHLVLFGFGIKSKQRHRLSLFLNKIGIEVLKVDTNQDQD